MAFKYTDDDYCDIYPNKLCDNCGKCLEMEGIDVRAIKIEDIAKDKKENKILEEEFIEDLKSNLSEEDLEEIKEANYNLADIYKKFKDEHSLENDADFEDEEYVDAFENVDYLDNYEIDDNNIEEMTEEVYPGVRKLIKKNNKK